MEMPDTLLTPEERLALRQEWLFFVAQPKPSWNVYLTKAQDAKAKRVIGKWLSEPCPEHWAQTAPWTQIAPARFECLQCIASLFKWALGEESV